MKKRIISFLLSVIFLGTLSMEYISATIVAENTSAKTMEYSVEKRMGEKFVDDENLLNSDLILCTTDMKLLIPSYKRKIYTFTLNNTLFKPPINT